MVVEQIANKKVARAPGKAWDTGSRRHFWTLYRRYDTVIDAIESVQDSCT